MEHLKKGTDAPLAAVYESLRREIVSDQDELKRIVAGVGGESTMRKAAGWMVEKMLRLKMKTGGDEFGELGVLEALESLALGITGKGLLWRALRHALRDSPLLKEIDLGTLEQRAAEQFERVEALRLECACRALRLPAPDAK